MKDWKAAARNWVRRSKQFATKGVTDTGFPNYYNSKYEYSIKNDTERTNSYHKHLKKLGWTSKYSAAGGMQWKAPKQ